MPRSPSDVAKQGSRDPLQNPAFREPGLFENLRDLLLGPMRPLNCVQIEVTSCCQSRCSYCPRAIYAETWQSRHMSAETFASLWPLLRKSGRAHLQGWGEPLLHPRFFDFQALAKKAGCATSTTTCGMVMNEDLATKLATCGLDIIAFSLAGTDMESNQARKNAPFEAVCANIRFLQQAIARLPHSERPEIHFAYLLLPDQIASLHKLPDLMASLDIACAVISTIDYVANPEQAANAFLPDRDHKEALAILAQTAEATQAQGRRLHYSLPQTGTRAGGCREETSRSVFASACGDISPCVYLNVPEGRPGAQKIVFGNSLEKDAWEIWQQEDFRAFRANLANNLPAPACMDCPKRYEAQPD